jgi:Protein of unknown function (DUF3179)
VWKRTVKGRALHFYLAGINNQNFLMRDRETGTWWQQITGKALYGPLQGETLDLVLSDELTFSEWRSEFPAGQVLAPVPKYAKEYDTGWEPKVAKLPVVISFPGTELKSRDVVIGVAIDGAARAYPWDRFMKDSPVIDHLNGTPLLLVLGPDGKSFRVFVSRVDGRETEFFLQAAGEPEAGAGAPAAKSTSQNSENLASAKISPTGAWVLIDSSTASEWNFQGCAISGPERGKCLNRVPALKDYWFDWRNYHPQTSVVGRLK